MRPRSVLAVVQEQLDAYNAKDIEALLATYAPDGGRGRWATYPDEDA